MTVRNLLGLLVAGLVLVLPVSACAQSTAPASSGGVPSRTPAPRAEVAPDVGHVFVVNIENKGFARTWGANSKAPYLARTLRARGVLLTQYYGTAHHSLGNYIAQVSGQGPSRAMQSDCPTYSRFALTGTVAPGQAKGTGCVYPASVDSLPMQLTRSGREWKGYMDDMERSCQHPRLGRRDTTGHATARHNYATKHNPFMYFRAITSRARFCAHHVVRLAALKHDLATAETTPQLSYVTPDLCHDGHDAPCADGRRGGLAAVNGWMRTWVPRILASPAFQRDGVLVITADESEGVKEDSSACCDGGAAANVTRPGIDGPGGGRIGALVLSPFVTGGTASATPYNHYSLLASIEDAFGLARLGYAGAQGVRPFGADVYNGG